MVMAVIPVGADPLRLCIVSEINPAPKKIFGDIVVSF